MTDFKYDPKPKQVFEKGVKFTMNDSIDYMEGSIVSKIIIRNEKGNVTLFSFDKGESLSEHTAPFDAIVEVVDGSADIIIDGISNHVNAGETIIMPANIPHAVVAIEKFKMLLIMVKA